MAIISFSQIFNLAASTKTFFMADTSDYAGQGISPSTITGSFRITAPSGNVVYDNLINYKSGTLADIIGTTFLYTHNTIAGNLNAVPLEQGVYSIFYQVWDSNTSTTSTVTETFNLLYASPTVTISGTVQVYTPSPLITLQDTTVYQVSGVDPTISRVATISYEPMLINNVLTTPTPTVGVTATTTSNTFYSPTTELLSVVSNLIYVFSNFTVLDLVSGSQSLFVDATTYCATVCGLNQLACDHVADPNNSDLTNDFNLAMSYWTLIMANQNCGNMDVINGYLKDIRALGHFNTDCDCGCGDKFQQVIGLGGLVSAYNVISANSYITVSPVTSGGTTTFTIELSSAFIALVNSQTTDISTLQGQVITLQNNSVTLSSPDGTVQITNTGSNPTNKGLQARLRSSISDEVSDNKTLSGTTPLVIFTVDAVAAIDGNYVLEFEADFSQGTTAGAGVACDYYFILNGATTTPIGVNGTDENRTVSLLPNISETQTVKISIKTRIDLVATDAINVVIVARDAHDTMIVSNRTLLITRYSS